jgi:leucyl aminopeptidase
MSVNKKVAACLAITSLVLPFIAQAGQAKEQVVVTNCMYNQLKSKSKLIAQTKQFSLIELMLNEGALQELHQKSSKCGKFLNVSRLYNSNFAKASDSKNILAQVTHNKASLHNVSFPIKHPKEVEQMFANIDQNKIWQTAEHLTSYYNRSATTDLGVEAALWFKEHFDMMAKDYQRSDVDSYYVETGWNYQQPSVVTVIGKDKKSDAIVIGAHIDTFSGNKPGADDDASGIAVELEVARVLLASKIELKNPVYIIAYAAEERGLVGSDYVVESFLKKKIPVKAVMQLDQAGYRSHAKDKTIWLLSDYIDEDLTNFTAKLLETYVNIPVAYTVCGYACSDHANWYREGFKTTYPSATTLDDDNPNVHTARDKLETINLEHMVNFTKLGLAFSTELGLD